MDWKRGRVCYCRLARGEPNRLQLERGTAPKSQRGIDCGDGGGGAHEDRYHHRRGCCGGAFVRGMDVHRQTGRGQAGWAHGVPDERRGHR